MGTRLELHELLCKILGKKDVYYQKPENLKMKYPCIVYKCDYIKNDFADDIVYKQQKRYQVIVIDYHPDSKIADVVSRLPRCSFDRINVSDGLYHFFYKIYY